MRVTQLQQFIQSLIPPLQASGASKSVIGGLEGAANHLEPFKDLSIEEFAAFLGRAEEYARTGIVAVVDKSAPKPRVKKELTSDYTVEAALSDIRNLHEQSVNENVTYAMIEEGVQKLDKLKKAELDLVTSEFGLRKSKTKPAALGLIREKIVNFKKTHQRTQF